MFFMRKSKHRNVLIAISLAALTIGLLYLAAIIATDPADNLVIDNVRFVAGGEERRITGEVFNVTKNRTYSDVAVEAMLYDEAGNELGVAEDTTDVLEPGARWQFVARAPADAVGYETRVHSPDNTRPAWLIAAVIGALRGE